MTHNSHSNEHKQMGYHHTPIEKKFTKIISPVEKFAENQIASSVLLLIFTFTALGLATNDHTAAFYAKIINYNLGFHLGEHYFSGTLQYWVNDILLALFFFIIGLEIKRDFLVGELTSISKVSVVVLAAAGGMLFPALIYYYINYGTPYANGWGIPIATDTAFVLGILALFRFQIPKTLIAFAAAISIFDDLGAISVIAIFYTPSLNVNYFFLALLGISLLFIFNLVGVKRALPYVIVGVLVFIATQLSGVHGTLAGILIAFTIPARPETSSRAVLRQAKQVVNEFEVIHNTKHSFILEDDEQYLTLKKMQEIVTHGTTPLQRWGSALEKPVGLFILPLFALTNAGINIEIPLLKESWHHPIVLGTLAGLVLGKFLGISIPCLIAKYFGWGRLPAGIMGKHIVGIALLSGIGFTMSIFIGDLSFETNSQELAIAKTGILIASVTAGLLAFFWFKWITKRKTA